MKRILILLLVVLLAFAMLIGCSDKNGQDQDNGGQDSNNGDQLVENGGQQEENDGLTEDQARELAQAWLDDHPEMATPYEPTTIAGVDEEMYSYEGQEYYLVYLDGYYWLDILVHSETGEMLCIVTEDSDEPVEPVIEPLEDYYNRYY